MKPRLFKKPRKRRTKSLDMCEYCYGINCDPMSMSHKFQNMVEYRLENNLCVGCGNNPCICKSSSKIKRYKERNRDENNKM